MAAQRDLFESSPSDRINLLALLATVHNLVHLIRIAEHGGRPHEQDRLDAARWLPDLERQLKALPEPETRLIPAGAFGGADPIEHYYPEIEDQ